MPDREFIHSSNDVASTLNYAFDSGMHIIDDTPQLQPKPYMLMRSEINKIEKGIFYLFRPEWVYGQFQMMTIPDGCNRGKYSVQPRVNFSPMTIYFSGEQKYQGKRKLGTATVSSHSDWLELPTMVTHPTLPEVYRWFKNIVAHLASDIIIRAGVHKYHVCRGVLADPTAKQCLPPFDFIPWNSESLKLPIMQSNM